MKKLNALGIFSILFIMACQQKPLEFVELKQFCRIDTLYENGKPYIFKNDYFLLENYKENLQSEKTIDSIAYKKRALDLNKYTAYTLNIYKSSDVTNLANLKKVPINFNHMMFDNDRVFSYEWAKGKWSGKFKWDNRNIVEGQPMIRED
jgi:hypothetical protein